MSVPRRRIIKAYHDASAGAVTDELNAREQRSSAQPLISVNDARQRLVECALRYPGMAFVKMDRLHADVESTIDRSMRFIFDIDSDTITLSVLAIRTDGEDGWRYHIYSNWASTPRDLARSIGFQTLLNMVVPIQAALERESIRIGLIGDP